MKKITSILAFVLALAWVSCTPEALTTINEITDHYTAPEGAVELTTLSNAQATWSLDRRYFDLSFTGNGASLETRLVGYEALLPAHQYVLGPDEIGNALAANTKVNGKAVDNGYIMVTNKDGKYQISGTFGDQVLYWTGTLPFQEDPAPTQLTEVLSAQSNKANGVNSLSMNLATPGIHQEFNQETYQQYWVGEGGYLALDIYSDDGYLHDGQYTACAEGGTINPGEFGIGYDTTMEFWGQVYEVKDWGTCWWTVKDGAATAEKILGGLVTVTSREEKVDDKDVTIWTIFWGKDYPTELIFEGAIPALTKPKPVVADPDYLYTDTITAGDGQSSFVDTHAITITDKGGNVVAYLELLTEMGATDLSGSYPATSYASQPGQMRDGYDGGSMEYGGQTYTWPGGGSYYVLDGEQKYLYANTATVVVTPIATGAYNFTCEFFNYNAAGPDYVPSGGGDFDGVILTQFGGLVNYYQMYGEQAPIIGIEMATAGVTITPGGWGNTYTGEGNYLKLEFGTADGNVAPGTYTACAVGGVVGPTEFGIGYDGMFGASGTAWYTVSATNTYEYVLDGTLTIDKDGDNYTIILKSSVVNAKYVGPLQ